MSNYNNRLDGDGHLDVSSATSYVLYVPLNYNTGNRVQPKVLKQIQSELLHAMGELTEFIPGVGFWTAPSGRVFRDDILPIQIVAPASVELEHWLTSFAAKLAVVLEQQSIFMVAQGVNVITSTPTALSVNNGKEGYDEQDI